MFDLTAIFVSHRTADLCLDAVASLRRAAAQDGVRPFVVVVDCDSGDDDSGRLEDALADRLILLRENRGYSGGLNAGIAAAESKTLLFCNSDVSFRPGSIGALLEASAQKGVGAAAPVQFADRSARIYMPSGFGSRFTTDLLQSLGGAPGLCEGRRFASAAAAQWALWTRGGDAGHLTGSILMTRRDVIDRVGRFDERLTFEYEETEWEDRVRAAGLRLRVVADSTAFHFHGSSSAKNPDSGARRETSRRLYRRRKYGAIGSAVLRFAERFPAPPAAEIHEAIVKPPGEGYALAVSPNRSVLPFAGLAFSAPIELHSLFEAIGPSLFLRPFRVRDGRPEGRTVRAAA